MYIHVYTYQTCMYMPGEYAWWEKIDIIIQYYTELVMLMMLLFLIHVPVSIE